MVRNLITDSMVSTTVEGNTTIVAFANKDIVAVGVARCSPKDKFSLEVGRMIATGRAIEDYGRKLSDLWEARAVTKAEWKAKHE